MQNEVHLKILSWATAFFIAYKVYKKHKTLLTFRGRKYILFQKILSYIREQKVMLQHFLHNKIALILLCCTVPLLLEAARSTSRADNVDFSKRFQKKYGDHHIIIRQAILSPQVTGNFPVDRTVEKCADRFYQTLKYLPDDLIRKTRLKYVTFLRNLKLNKEAADGVASGDTIYLSVDFSQKTVFHEFFHIFDTQHTIPSWCNLNEKNFIYTGSKFYKHEFNRQEERQVRKNKRQRSIRDSFVSRYAMSNEMEDRAETFAHMIVEGKKFLKRCDNPVMSAKMQFIMDMFIKKGLLKQEFWKKHLECKFNSKNRFYTEQGNANKKSKK